MAKKRVDMVGEQSGTLQWLIGYTTKGIDSYSNRSIQKKLVDFMSRGQNRGSVAQEGTGSTYQSAGTFRHNVCHLDICQNMENFIYTYPGRQHDSLELFAKNSRDKESITNADLKGNQGFLLRQGITIIAKHLPGNLNCKADWESRHLKNSSEWKLGPLILSKLCQILGKKSETDLFISRLSDQLPSYYSWKPDPNSLGTDALQQKWYHKGLYAFSPFALIHKVQKKVEKEKVLSNNTPNFLIKVQLSKPKVGNHNSHVFQ